MIVQGLSIWIGLPRETQKTLNKEFNKIIIRKFILLLKKEFVTFLESILIHHFHIF